MINCTCAVNYFIVRIFTPPTTPIFAFTTTTTTTTARRPALEPVAITHVFLAEDVGGAFVASDRSSAPSRSREHFLQPMSGGRAPHACPSQSGGRHESPDNPPSNHEASGGEKPLPPKERERTAVRRIVAIAADGRRLAWSGPVFRETV